MGGEGSFGSDPQEAGWSKYLNITIFMGVSFSCRTAHAKVTGSYVRVDNQ